MNVPKSWISYIKIVDEILVILCILKLLAGVKASLH